MAQTLEFWFEFASTYTYPAAMRIEDECARAGVPLLWRPFLLGPIFKAQQGIDDSPFKVRPVRGNYMWRDLERLCEKQKLPFARPSVFPRNSVLAARIACIGQDASWIGAFVREVFLDNFARDRDIADREVLRAALSKAGVDAEAVLKDAADPKNKSLLRGNTEAATARGVFGAPNFFVGSEHFFGQDRLADAIAWATG